MHFDYFQPTNIRFGCGRIAEAGDVVRGLGRRCLLVTVPLFEAIEPAVEKVKRSLQGAGVEVTHFDGVTPNPTVDSITVGAQIARDLGADVVLGLGGGSSMDSAKAIAVEATHKGTCWDYRWCSETQPTEMTLPVVAVSTTSGTGSHVTQVAVITNSERRDKSAIYNPIVYPKTAIVDPDLMRTVPEHVTASTGFDAFTHSFETFIHTKASPYTDMLAKEAMRLIVENLPAAVSDGSNLEARTAMAWADTLAGLCIANAGVTLPHGIGMAISGMWPHVMHGESLAVTYPSFTRYTCSHAAEKFAAMGRILNPGLAAKSDEEAANEACGELDRFLQKIGMWLSLKGLDIPEDELAALGKQCMVLPDYQANPKVATLEEIMGILQESYHRV